MADTAIASRFNKPADDLKAGMPLAALALGSLVGTWVNVNSATRDIVKVVLTNANGTLNVHAYGACSPTPCDWGQVKGMAYAASVSGGNAVAFTANYAFGFKNTILHGFGTLARAIEGLIRAKFAGDVNALAEIDVRFTRPLVLPARVGLYVSGERIWVGDAPGGPAYLEGTFKTRARS